MSAASNVSAFLDTTLSRTEGIDAPSIVASTGIPLTILNAPSDRVVPLLIRDVATHTQVRQRMHLKLFSDHLDDFIVYDDTTEEEWDMLLVMLFCLMRRRGGLTPMQTTHNNDVSDICFSMINHLLSQNHPKFQEVLESLKRVMDQLDCTADKFFERGESAPPPNEETICMNPNIDADVDKNGVPDIEQIPKLQAEAEAPSVTLPSAAASGKETPGFKAHPFFYTIDSLHPEHRIGMCETDFQAASEWFHALEVDPMNQTVRMVLRGMQSNPVIGNKFCSPGVMAEFQACYPQGGCSLFDFVRFLFRFVPDRVLLRRCNGVVLSDDVTAETMPPAGASHIPTVPDEISDCLRVLQRTSAVQCTPEIVSLLRTWWGYVVFHVEDGQLASYTTSGAIAAANNGVLGDWTVDANAIVSAKGGNDIIIFADIVKQLFPEASSGIVRVAVTKAHEDAQLEMDRVLHDKAANNAAFAEQLKAHIENPPSPSKAPPSAPQAAADQPAGTPRMTNVLTAPMLQVIATMNGGLKTEYDRCTSANLKVAVLTNERLRLEMHRQQVEENHRMYQAMMDRKNVSIAAGPTLPPADAELFGFRISPSVFHLDDFLDPDRGHRVQAVNIMDRLDKSGIVAAYFIADPSAIHHYIPVSLMQPCRVYKDFAYCSKRPSTGTYWEGNQVLHIKTNIPAHSDIKYRLVLEGYNFGLNAPVYTTIVGYAARQLDKVDQLESFGWPDAWDKATIKHHGKGITSSKQYYSADGHVCIRCEARSFSNIGFSMSAWLVCRDFGAGFAIKASVHHQEDSL